MKLVWKLLRQHISIGQLVGFFLANLLGMLIVLVGMQFYSDVQPAFSQEDGFMKDDYLIVSKQLTTLDGLIGGGSSFTVDEMADLARQPFAKNLAGFTAGKFGVRASVQIGGMSAMGTEMFFESVPDAFVDASLDEWRFAEGQHLVPIILPRTYLALYNFGFAPTRSMPKISEELASSIVLDITLVGNGSQERFVGRVVGFSNRLNTILVPQSFMDWANNRFAPNQPVDPTRLILQVGNPADAAIIEYFEGKGYEIADDKLDAGKTTFFVRLVAGIVVLIGLLISALSFYVLMLSIYLLVQKNTQKLQNLLLIGYSPARVCLPYQCLTVGINALVLVLSVALMLVARNVYLAELIHVFPDMQPGSLMPAMLLGLGLFVMVSIVNCIAVRRKVMAIWQNKE